MDPVGLEILVREIAADRLILADAASKASQRVNQRNPGHLEACAFELSRFYSVLERMLERTCEAFENHLEKKGDYHDRLLQRLSLDLPGLRPAFIPASALTDLRELKGFRHVVRHAYDLQLREDRLRELSMLAEKVSAAIPAWCEAFDRTVRRDQGW